MIFDNVRTMNAHADVDPETLRISVDTKATVNVGNYSRGDKSRGRTAVATLDHVHMCIKIPPKISVSDFMGYLKGKSALMIFDRFPEYKQRGNRHFWARGYYVDTVGRNEEQIRKYIADQTESDKLEDSVKV